MRCLTFPSYEPGCNNFSQTMNGFSIWYSTLKGAWRPVYFNPFCLNSNSGLHLTDFCLPEPRCFFPLFFCLAFDTLWWNSLRPFWRHFQHFKWILKTVLYVLIGPLTPLNGLPLKGKMKSSCCYCQLPPLAASHIFFIFFFYKKNLPQKKTHSAQFTSF